MVLALCSRQAAGCLPSVLSVLESECEAPEGCVCAPASASTTRCCTYNCFLTKASLVLSRRGGKVGDPKKYQREATEPSIFSWIKGQELIAPALKSPVLSL